MPIYWKWFVCDSWVGTEIRPVELFDLIDLFVVPESVLKSDQLSYLLELICLWFLSRYWNPTRWDNCLNWIIWDESPVLKSRHMNTWFWKLITCVICAGTEIRLCDYMKYLTGLFVIDLTGTEFRLFVDMKCWCYKHILA